MATAPASPAYDSFLEEARAAIRDGDLESAGHLVRQALALEPERAAAYNLLAAELAIALHPVSEEELMAVADTGLQDPDVVMPEKSTFFSPKIPTGLVLLRARD